MSLALTQLFGNVPDSVSITKPAGQSSRRLAGFPISFLETILNLTTFKNNVHVLTSQMQRHLWHKPLIVKMAVKTNNGLPALNYHSIRLHFLIMKWLAL